MAYLPSSLESGAGPRFSPCSRREAWLEAELLRLGARVEQLAEVNQALKDQIFDDSESVSSDVGAADDVLELEQIDLEPNEAEGNAQPRKIRVRLSRSAESIDPEEDDEDLPLKDKSIARLTGMTSMMAGRVNTMVMKGSALSLGRGGQAFIYLIALAGIVFVLVALAFPPDIAVVGEHDEVGLYEHIEDGGASGHSSTALDDHHRRLNAAHATPHLMKNIAVTLTSCGLIAFTVNILKQPLILGYLLGGVLVGPIGLGIVENHMHISELSSLGLIFLLFMIGLELDVKALLNMGKVVLVTGFLQFPICAGVMAGIFMALEAIGLNFGSGAFASMYCGLTCGISSTMIVAKMLGEKGEMGSQAGRLTVGILIFQDIWAIIVLAIQPNLASPEVGGILKTFGMIAVLIGIALAYAKFVMPALLYHTSNNLELMLVLSLAWCFFICCIAVLPFIGLSMELASLIAGVALASFPYSAEFNGKIKYIRDFFITLFFAALGMQIPTPSVEAIAMGALIAIVVLVVRWLGIFVLVWMLGGGTELASLATINLSQISEFALVICSLGMGFGHIGHETMTIIIWTFAILAISASYLIGYNQLIYDTGMRLVLRLLGKASDGVVSEGDHHGHGDERDVVLLGFHKIAFMLVTEVKAKSPQLLPKMHVIDFDQAMMPKLREVGLTCTYGDISSPDVLEHAFHGDPNIVICSIPDAILRGTTNAELIKVCHQVWPKARVIVTADSPQQASTLYRAGADYVLRTAKLCGERLHMLLSENRQQVFGDEDLAPIFRHFKNKDKELRVAEHFIAK